mmetsp:Transcript_39874/g.66165  ORF Transcript_39874/g.66165 Transcript_39874/m.66165 type:complete len:743 (+) Transcript_39874:14-2242(+)|eukprot:CAMPEP_0119329584 /NCGR_PEP_ID=MMETSP1333-20130426/76195_1 /TAXON_ID=418940 /ORGANISM="Scyphosphaera apsteinii, Strain RCC1455" /LENGTH=742 /DNA_ID=CAMNT_0007338741 /DNA_START=10 /DNA_END=2238 /DNA_ORIENTATION=+
MLSSRHIAALACAALLVLAVIYHTNSLVAKSSYGNIALLRNVPQLSYAANPFEEAQYNEQSKKETPESLLFESRSTQSRLTDNSAASAALSSTRPAGTTAATAVDTQDSHAAQSKAEQPLQPLQTQQQLQAQPAQEQAALSSQSPSPPAAKKDMTVGTGASIGQCPPGRKPYHVVMTAASGTYQEWQSRIAYYHYQKQKRLNPCSELGSFTRLFNTPGARPDSLMDEIPTLLVKQLGHGRCNECDHGFIVMNRPWGAVQLVESSYFDEKIAEEYILVMETDHMIMRPPPNDATEEKPVGFGFYYMISTDKKLEPVVRKFLNPEIDITTVDNVGPSPLLIHKPLLRKLARPWWELSLKMKGDSAANQVFGWVLEMWGYNLAARNLGIRHTVSKDIQVEPQGTGTDDMETKYIYHYTFGLVVPDKRGKTWRIDKRQYYGYYPADNLGMPPTCSARSGFIITSLFNEASQHIEGWQTQRGGREGRSMRGRNDLASNPAASDSPLYDLSKLPLEQPGLGELLRGTGPWNWGSLDSLYLFARGVAYASFGTNQGAMGRWSVAAGSTDQLDLELCDKSYRLTFADPTAPWAFSSLNIDTQAKGHGVLPDVTQHLQTMLPPPAANLRLAHFGSGLATGGNASFAEELAGSGPWSWAGNSPLAFLRGGVLLTPWGRGNWGVTRRQGAETAASTEVFADFAGSEHTVRLLDSMCLRLQSSRKSDGDRVGIEFLGTQTVDSVGVCETARDLL